MYQIFTPHNYNFSHLRHRSNLLKYLAYFLLIAVLAITVVFLIDRSKKVSQKQEKENARVFESVKTSWQKILDSTEKSGIELTKDSSILLQKGQIELAIMGLQKACQKDQYYRDCPILLGYGYLKLADTEKQKNQRTSVIEQYNKAREAFEEAIKRDPLFAKNYQLLALSYQFLGDDKNSQLTNQKALDF